MDTLYILQITWFILIGVLLLGYSILDGFDLGIGALMPLLAKKENEKRALMSAIGPFWDGNEVWLLTGGGALFASFPHVYATVFSGFYLAMMLVLFALIFRAVSIEFYAYDNNKKLWEWCFIIGSFLPALLFGVALGNVIVGVPLDKSMNFTGNFFTLLRPFPLAVGLLGLNAFLLQGTTYAALKTNGDIQDRATMLTKKLQISFIALFLVNMVLAYIYIPGVFTKSLAWLFTAITLAGWFRMGQLAKKGKHTHSFIMSSLAFTGLWGITASILFPYLVRASNDLSLSLTITNSSSSELTLKVMSIFALIGVPLVLFYTWYLFKTFKGKVSLNDGGH
ncbi:MAG: cytochrome d ubiquinol oxidase subunit II [bacterium]|nr:cytochrome d ubiquinol oxidase subunit II [bacterium]